MCQYSLHWVFYLARGVYQQSECKYHEDAIIGILDTHVNITEVRSVCWE